MTFCTSRTSQQYLQRFIVLSLLTKRRAPRMSRKQHMLVRARAASEDVPPRAAVVHAVTSPHTPARTVANDFTHRYWEYGWAPWARSGKSAVAEAPARRPRARASVHDTTSSTSTVDRNWMDVLEGRFPSSLPSAQTPSDVFADDFGAAWQATEMTNLHESREEPRATITGEPIQFAEVLLQHKLRNTIE